MNIFSFPVKYIAVMVAVTSAFFASGEETEVRINNFRNRFDVNYRFDVADLYTKELKEAGFSDVKLSPQFKQLEINITYIGNDDGFGSTWDSGEHNAYWNLTHDGKTVKCKLISSHTVVKTEKDCYSLQAQAIIYGPVNTLCFFYQFSVKKLEYKGQTCYAIIPGSITCNQKATTLIFSSKSYESW